MHACRRRASVSKILLSKYTILDRSCGFQLPIDKRRHKNVRTRHRETQHRLVHIRTDAEWSCYDDIDGVSQGLGSISIKSDDAVLLCSVDHWTWKSIPTC